MGKPDVSILGKRVMPLVKRAQYDANNLVWADQLSYLKGDDRQRLGTSMVDKAVREARKDNKEQEWSVGSVHMNGTYSLWSDFGYEKRNVSRSHFRLLKEE